MLTIKTRRRLLGCLGGWGLALIAIEAATPVAARGRPDAFVRQLAADVLAVLRDPSLASEERLRRVDRAVSAGFALDRIAKIALGRYWKAASDAERAEFVALFKAAVLASYGRRFADYADRELRVAATQPSGEQVMVESYLEGGQTPIRLDWRVAVVDGGWRVLDVMVESISLVVTYRNEFAAVIEQGGGRVSALIGELRSRSAAQGSV